MLEGLLGHERATGGNPASVEARLRGEAYLLERRLLYRRSTGELIDPQFRDFAFPTRWHFDVLRGLEHFRAVGSPPDPRLAEAIELLRSKRRPDGTWLLDHAWKGAVHVPVDDGVGQPSRWNTLRAMRVLRWADGTLDEAAA